jgi:HAD superfamily hydrolase (TIGR01509 family)
MTFPSRNFSEFWVPDWKTGVTARGVPARGDPAEMPETPYIHYLLVSIILFYKRHRRRTRHKRLAARRVFRFYFSWFILGMAPAYRGVEAGKGASMSKSEASKPKLLQEDASPGTQKPAVLFDLDGTLMDSAYEHVSAWQQALHEDGVQIVSARIHRCVGMSGKLMLQTLFREIGRPLSAARTERLEKIHKRRFAEKISSIRALPGARELLRHLSSERIHWAVATGGDKETVMKMIKPLRIPPGVPVITADHVERAKPDPDVFLEAAQGLSVQLKDCIVVGDSVWDLLAARRAKALGVGVLSGGYGEAELIQAGAYRVYKNPAELLERIAEIGV